MLLGGVARKGENWSLLVWRCSSCEPLMVVGFGGPVKMGSVGLGRKRWVVVVVEEGGQVWVRGWALGDL